MDQKIRLVLLVLIAALVQVIQSETLQEHIKSCNDGVTGCFTEPINCDISKSTIDCEAGVFYKTKGDGKLTMTMFSKSQNSPLYYLAVGFSNDQRMGDDTVVQCVFDSSDVTKSKSYLAWNQVNYEGRSSPRLSDDAIANNLNQINVAQENQYVFCTVAVPLVPLLASGSTDRMLPFLGDYYLMLATGPATNTDVQMHTVRSVSPVKIDAAKHRRQLSADAATATTGAGAYPGPTQPPPPFIPPRPPTPPNVDGQFPGGTIVDTNGFFNIEHCQRSQCDRQTGECSACLLHPFNCTMDQRLSAGRRCEAAVKITSFPSRREDFVTMTLVRRIDDALSEQYVAVGFSEDHKMGDDAVTECVYSKGAENTFNAFLSYNDGRTNKRLSEQMTAGHLEKALSWAIIDGYMACTVKQKVSSKNAQVYSMDKQYVLLLAVGPASNTELRAHTTDHDDEINFPVASKSKVKPFGAQGMLKLAPPSSSSSEEHDSAEGTRDGSIKLIQNKHTLLVAFLLLAALQFRLDVVV